MRYCGGFDFISWTIFNNNVNLGFPIAGKPNSNGVYAFNRDIHAVYAIFIEWFQIFFKWFGYNSTSIIKHADVIVCHIVTSDYFFTRCFGLASTCYVTSG
uniref:Uncharacterized protein n=1 Tax=Cacopsylla melanoneura TaxID=428564 RepID=A0A8D8RWR0_9HEMI